MAKRYTIEEKQILKDFIYDGALVNDLCLMLPDRTYRALTQQINSLGYGIKTIRGVKYITSQKRKRNNAVDKFGIDVKTPLSTTKTTIDIIANYVNKEKSQFMLNLIIDDILSSDMLLYTTVNLHAGDTTIVFSKETP